MLGGSSDCPIQGEATQRCPDATRRGTKARPARGCVSSPSVTALAAVSLYPFYSQNCQLTVSQILDLQRPEEMIKYSCGLKSLIIWGDLL